MRKITQLLLLLLVCNYSLFASRRTLTEMRQALSTLQKNHRFAAKSSINKSVNVLHEEEQLTVLGNDGFFAILANDDAFEPILAYSYTSFDKNDLDNPGFKWWLEAMNQSLDSFSNQNAKANTVSVSTAYKPAVDALIQTKWNQDTPYNNLTPTYTENDKAVHYVTGCVATAMAQAMKYYNYPEKGKGTKSYRCKLYISDKEVITKMLTVNFASGTYDWNNMLNVYSKSGYTQEEADAVARLMYHCGVSVTMDYDKSGSGSYTFKAIKALIDNFQYSPGLQFYIRAIYSTNEWMDIICNHLSQGHPIIYSGQKEGGGHAFVVDGYDEDGRVHVNWGWGGKSDGYFNISSLNGYTLEQTMVPVFLDETSVCHAVFGLYDNSVSFSLMGVNLSASATYVLNGDYRNFEGTMGLLATSLENGKTSILASNPISVEGYGINLQLHFTDLNFKKIDISSMEDGNYRIYLATLRNDDIEWQAVRAADDKSNSAILSIASGVAHLTVEKNPSWTIDTEDALEYIVAPWKSYSNTIYDLSGRHVQYPTKGIYIKNGKKVLK